MTQTTHNTQEQDLRTALDFQRAALEAIHALRHKAAATFTPAYSGSEGQARCDSFYEAYEAVRRLPVAAPPRPVDAERVEIWGVENTGDAIWVGPMRPDGVKIDRVVYFKDDLGLHRSEYVAQVKADAHLICDSVNAALAPKPTGTETVRLRKVANPDHEVSLYANRDGLWSHNWLSDQPTETEAGRGVIPAGWKLVPVEMTLEMKNAMWRDFNNQGLNIEDIELDLAWRDALAVSPTLAESGQLDPIVRLKTLYVAGQTLINVWGDAPELPKELERALGAFESVWLCEMAAQNGVVSPSPDSTGPAGALLNDEQWKLLSTRHDQFDKGIQYPVGMRTVKAAAPTPSAPIADPVRDEGTRERILQRIAVFADMLPEEDETWESWYSAAFDMLAAEVSAMAPSPDSTGQGDAQTPTTIWHVVISIPGLNIDHYIASDREPSHEEITRAWQAGGSTSVPKPRDFKGPLRDAYPGITTVKPLKVWTVSQGDAQTQEGGR